MMRFAVEQALQVVNISHPLATRNGSHSREVECAVAYRYRQMHRRAAHTGLAVIPSKLSDDRATSGSFAKSQPSPVDILDSTQGLLNVVPSVATPQLPIRTRRRRLWAG